MVETLVSGVIDKLISLSRQQIEKELQLVLGVDEEINTLKENLQTIKYVLKDAGKREMMDSSVQHWLEKLEGVSYDMEDVLDEWSTAIMRSEVKLHYQRNPFLLSLFSCVKKLHVNQVLHRHDIAIQIKELNKRLADIDRERATLSFESVRTAHQELSRQVTTSFVDISEVYGREDDKKRLVNMLSSQTKKGPRVIALVGLGGSGKTTLAQLAFTDPQVKRNFEKRIWVSVSSPFDQVRIIKAILEALQEPVSKSAELQTLLQKLNKSIADKRFLLVLDDVWTESTDDWLPLKLSLNSGHPRSRILVTTRNENVAKMMEATHRLALGLLSDDDSWLLFSRLAFLKRDRDESQRLEDTGHKIVEKCKGLPLAVKSLGMHMMYKRPELWQHILDSEIWKLKFAEEHIFHSLLSSYYDLPSPLKCCFSYCSVFLKGEVIYVDKLIKLWMAQGFLKSEENTEMEEVGQEYFDILALRYFFQDLEKDRFGNTISCRMHDIVHDFAQFLMKKECYITTEDDQKIYQTNTVTKTIRHVTLTTTTASMESAEKIRTLIIKSSEPQMIVNTMWSYNCLRAFDCDHQYIPFIAFNSQVLEDIGNLMHIRYLNLSSCCEMTELPEAICDLYNLQTLNLSYCANLERLPQRMERLINLRHIYLLETQVLRFLPKGIEKLSTLRTLTNFKVCETLAERNVKPFQFGARKTRRETAIESSQLGALQHLNHLGGYLSITKLGTKTDKAELEKAELNKKKNLLDLVVEFSIKKNHMDNHTDIVSALQLLPPNLRSLTLINYNGSCSVPGWMMSLRELILLGNQNWESLPAIGRLPLLERLRLCSFVEVKKVDSEFLGISGNNDGIIAFPKLKYLEILYLSKWKEWDSTSVIPAKIMPSLSELKIYECPQLKSLPQFLFTTPLKRLQIEKCELLEEQYKKTKEWGQFSSISNFSTVCRFPKEQANSWVPPIPDHSSLMI